MLMSFIFARRIRPIYRSVRKDAEQIDGRVGETFSGIRVVRAFGREMRELLDYMRGRHTVLRKELFAHRRELVLWTSWGLLLAGVNVVIVWYGGYLNIVGRASIGDIMAFQWYTFLLLNPVWNIVNSFSELQRSLAAMERVFEVLAMEDDKPDRPDARRRAARSCARSGSRTSSSSTARASRSCATSTSTVPGGSVVALVGRSGAGKTTVTDLVARFHDPTRGRILLNGTDIRDFRLRTYRDLLAIVQQDVFLFDGSVRDNIAYGRHDATDAEVEDAARRANAHEFIVKLPERYETFVGERGVKLSGGQQQRLAIARAILASPQILILDEATSNLDTESEQLIQASMADAARRAHDVRDRASALDDPARRPDPADGGRPRHHADGERRSRKRHTGEDGRGCVHRAPELVGDLPGTRFGTGRYGDDKLVAAITARDSVGRDPFGDDLPDSAHGFRAGQVPVLVVQRFQAIDVEHEEAERRARLPRRSHERRQLRFKGAKVVQPGEVVGHRQRKHAAGIARASP